MRVFSQTIEELSLDHKWHFGQKAIKLFMQPTYTYPYLLASQLNIYLGPLSILYIEVWT